MKDKIINFVNDVAKEMKKVTWPTRDELKESTMVVLMASILMALFIFGVDQLITKLMQLVLSQ
jgi:preprotein translocase subunit SecE